MPFLDPPPPPPVPTANLLDWQRLDSWITPSEAFFALDHYGVPALDVAAWRLRIGGRVAHPRDYTLDDLRALPKKELVFTLECSGNSGFDWFHGGIGNGRFGGTPLAGVLEAAGVAEDGIEVVFFGADKGRHAIPYVGGLGEAISTFQGEINFARSMTLQQALDPENLLCYELNGASLPRANGFPLRLVAPRWYGVANVKWLERIEVWDTRFEGPFMAERYVTVRREKHEGGQPVFIRASVGKTRLKSMTAKVTVKDGRYRIHGAAWGGPVANVEVRIDDGPWTPATLTEGREHRFAWKFWVLDWKDAAPGEHRITSRAIDEDGNVQPAPEDPVISDKLTYWEANGQITRRIAIPRG